MNAKTSDLLVTVWLPKPISAATPTLYYIHSLFLAFIFIPLSSQTLTYTCHGLKQWDSASLTIDHISSVTATQMWSTIAFEFLKCPGGNTCTWSVDPPASGRSGIGGVARSTRTPGPCGGVAMKMTRMAQQFEMFSLSHWCFLRVSAVCPVDLFSDVCKVLCTAVVLFLPPPNNTGI